MRILIIEDERPAAQGLHKQLSALRPGAEIAAVLPTIEDSVAWLRSFPPPDLIFLDIQLADGLSFGIFEEVEVLSPVIFTTAYDEFLLRAFSVNSVDYLLKPIGEEALGRALAKFEKHHLPARLPASWFSRLLQPPARPLRERFLVRAGPAMQVLMAEEVAYFYAEERVVFAMTQGGKAHLVEQPLDQLQQELDPARFFRINRKMIIHIGSLRKIHPYFNSRLQLELEPAGAKDRVVSRDRVRAFKAWLGS
jgi:DNA-binding LytR/AlgR family response regulator